MPALYTISESPFSTPCLERVLEIATGGPTNKDHVNDRSRADISAVILLIEDGVYGALDCDHNRHLLGRYLKVDDARAGHKRRPKTGATGIALYALEPDLDARGITQDRRLDVFSTVDYEGFVELCCHNNPIVSW